VCQGSGLHSSQNPFLFIVFLAEQKNMTQGRWNRHVAILAAKPSDCVSVWGFLFPNHWIMLFSLYRPVLDSRKTRAAVSRKDGGPVSEWGSIGGPVSFNRFQ